MTKITIVGTGNVAFHLCKVFKDENFEVEVYGRNSTSLADFKNKFDITVVARLSDIDPKSLVILCVSDDQISPVLNSLDENIPVAYTSGTVALDSLPRRENLGILYPLQTFSKSKEVDFFQVPILIEANNEIFAQKLFDLAWKISSKVEFADSEKRKKVHLAAVFVNNFTNHLFYLAKNQLDAANIDWNILKPLIKETISKIEHISPFDAQTGPAIRNDFQTLKNQEELLNGNSLAIYKALTNSIIETYKINSNEKL